MAWRRSSALLVGTLLTSSALAQAQPRELAVPEPARQPAPVATEPSLIEPMVNYNTYLDRFTVTGDYLWWWMKRAPSPAPYITTTRELGEGIPDEFTGAVGDPGTKSIVDHNSLNFGIFSGLRLRAAAQGPLVGLELGGFLLERRSGGDFIAADQPTNQFTTDGGFPFIARTFYDVVADRENAYFVSVPTFSTGSSLVSNQVTLFGYEANATVRLACWDRTEWTAFVGHRFLGLNENLEFHDRTRSLADDLPQVAIYYLGQPVFRDGIVDVHDSFRTSNRFYGVQLGSITRYSWSDCFSFVARGSIAFGVNQQLAEINGYTQLTPAPTDLNQDIRSTAGGIYAQNSNSGRYFQSEFSWATEGEVGFEYALTPNWKARVGYTLLVWNNVVRPGDLVDRRVDRRTVPSDPNYVAGQTADVPAFSWKQSDLWTQGFTFGLELQY
jgi:hypothetical protein